MSTAEILARARAKFANTKKWCETAQIDLFCVICGDPLESLKYINVPTPAHPKKRAGLFKVCENCIQEQ